MAVQECVEQQGCASSMTQRPKIHKLPPPRLRGIRRLGRLQPLICLKLLAPLFQQACGGGDLLQRQL